MEITFMNISNSCLNNIIVPDYYILISHILPYGVDYIIIFLFSYSLDKIDVKRVVVEDPLTMLTLSKLRTYN